MKKNRHSKIYEIIDTNEIQTQEDLINQLNRQGIDVTQATISRDIKELKLFKTLATDGNYIYSHSLPKGEKPLYDTLIEVFKRSVLDIKALNEMIVVKTIDGSASIVGEMIDKLYGTEVVGTIAGDNTLFTLCISKEKAIDVYKKLESHLKK
ncbi:arginine repressor [Clostridium grantii]|uniref:Arginine repressor n=1 Tax=Clostridium grantii DSM 8605 TaxID=1121316 RepID=A0A1M5UK25_9CLOT|nr:arginine repressor [Clostridium grantii]SHH63422.1 transcriptional regulator, ArgR family [Clostridium grantii DSM 8605]